MGDVEHAVVRQSRGQQFVAHGSLIHVYFTNYHSGFLTFSQYGEQCEIKYRRGKVVTEWGDSGLEGGARAP